LIVVGPVFVTVDAARTAKFPAVPSETGGVAALALALGGAAALALGGAATPIRAVVAQARARPSASRDPAKILRGVSVRAVPVGIMGFHSLRSTSS
jgi:hypothetical protein